MLDWLNRWASGLRFPALAALIAGLFLLDLAIPDLIPFVDEALLGLFAAALATLRKKPGAHVSEGDPVRDRGDSSRRDR